MCPRLVLEWAGSNSLVLEFSVQPYMVAWWLIQPRFTAEALVRIPGEAFLNSIFSQRNWCVETMGSRIMSLRDGYACLLLRGTRGIDSAGKVELVRVGGLWRMGGECLLMPVW